MNRKCADCVEYKRCRESAASWVFFIIGLIAIIAVRAVTILVHVNPVYGQVSWYVVVVGFAVFFAYKFRVDRARARIIRDSGLKDRILGGGSIEKNEREMIGALLCALTSKKDRINYFIIFVSSVAALVLAVYFDFIR